MLLSQKCGGNQEDADAAGLYFGKYEQIFDIVINLFWQQKSRNKTHPANNDCN